MVLLSGANCKHKPLIDVELWNRVQYMRKLNSTSTHNRCTQNAGICSLSGITYCGYCSGRIHVVCTKKNGPRLGCYNRIKGWDCQQKSASLVIFDEQIREYLETFHIPEDYQQRILKAHQELQKTYMGTKRPKVKHDARLERVKELYKWGDISRKEYLQEKHRIEKENMTPVVDEDKTEELDRLAEFLANIGEAWDTANQEQRNKLARCLFKEVWVKDKQVMAVKPQPELVPFFELNYEEFANNVLKMRPRGDLNP